jgi:hypothetical protein
VKRISPGNLSVLRALRGDDYSQRFRQTSTNSFALRLERGQVIAIVSQRKCFDDVSVEPYPFSYRDPFAFDDPVYRKQPLVEIGLRDEKKRHEGIVFQADL